MRIYKYQVGGNDFLVVDNTEGQYKLSTKQVSDLCHRRFGVGADGLVLLQSTPSAEFEIIYHNRDGSLSFCGNGSRACAHLAHTFGMIDRKFRFLASGSVLEGQIIQDEIVKICFAESCKILNVGDDFSILVGVNHHVRFVTNLDTYPVLMKGREIRYSEYYRPTGTNVSFVEFNSEKGAAYRTYEKGVEEETYCCASGAAACALALVSRYGFSSPMEMRALGGMVTVEFERKHDDTFSNISIKGAVKLVFTVDLSPNQI